MRRKILALLLALALLAGLSAPALAADKAAVIRLTKTTGEVAIQKSSGKPVSLLENMRLYGGYHVLTEEESYAWINLDDSKLLKEDASSEVEVRKDGKKLEVLVSSGNVFFDVSAPLEDDESLSIRTSTMVVGIRGTSGWLRISDGQVTHIAILEGEVECSVSDPVTGQVKTDTVRGGEWARGVVYDPGRQGDQCDIIKETFTVEEIPGYVLTDVVRDVELCDKIKENTGLDILEDLAAAAGGDPSGRTPDGKSASPEVLGIADQREDADEADLRERLETVERDLERQEQENPVVSPDKALEQEPAPVPPSSDDDRDDDDDDDPAPAPTPEPDPEPEPEDPTPPTPTPPTYSITFNANGGMIGGSPSTRVTTGVNGLAPWPSDPQYGEVPTDTDPNIGLTFVGWFTAKAGGTQMDETTVFTADTQLYAHWDGWFLDDAGTLVVAGDGPMEDDYVDTWDYGDHVYWPIAPWQDGVFTQTPTGNSNIGNAVILEGVTNLGEGAFFNCRNLANVTIPSSVTGIESGAFSGCSSLISLTIPSSVTSVGEFAFYNCTGLTSVTIPEGVASIGESTFSGCTNLTSLSIPNSVTSIGARFINGCENLTSLTLPSGLTSIEASAFEGSSLESITIPSTVTSIGDQAFRSCAKLASIEYGGTREAWEALTDGKNTGISSSVTVNCADDTP